MATARVFGVWCWSGAQKYGKEPSKSTHLTVNTYENIQQSNEHMSAQLKVQRTTICVHMQTNAYYVRTYMKLHIASM